MLLPEPNVIPFADFMSMEHRTSLSIIIVYRSTSTPGDTWHITIRFEIHESRLIADVILIMSRPRSVHTFRSDTSSTSSLSKKAICIIEICLFQNTAAIRPTGSDAPSLLTGRYRADVAVLSGETNRPGTHYNHDNIGRGRRRRRHSVVGARRRQRRSKPLQTMPAI